MPGYSSLTRRLPGAGVLGEIGGGASPANQQPDRGPRFRSSVERLLLGGADLEAAGGDRGLASANGPGGFVAAEEAEAMI